MPKAWASGSAGTSVFVLAVDLLMWGAERRSGDDREEMVVDGLEKMTERVW